MAEWPGDISWEQLRNAQRDFVELIISSPGRHLANYADELFLHIRMIRTLMLPEAERFILDTAGGDSVIDYTKKWDDSVILEALRQAASHEQPLSRRTYDSLVTQGTVVGPAAVTISKRFGTWRNACSEAGVRALSPHRPVYGRVWSDEELEHFVAEFLGAGTPSTSNRAYEEWRATMKAERRVPSEGHLRDRLGTWSEIRVAGLLRLRQEGSLTDYPGACLLLRTALESVETYWL